MKNIILIGLLLSTQVFASINLKDFGAIGDGITDDTIAIQSAINYAVSNSVSGSSIKVPAGTYLYSALVFPPAFDFPTSGQTIRLYGPTLPSQSLSVLDATTSFLGGAIFKCIATSGDSITTFSSSGFFNALTIDIENITFQFNDNYPSIGLNFRRAYALRLKGVTVYTGKSPYMVVQPTYSSGIGIATPANNNAAFTRLDDTTACGFYTGIELNEHTVGNEVNVYACIQGVTFPESTHANFISRLMTVQCQNGIVFLGKCKIVIDEYDIERAASGWKATINDIVDSSNLGVGNITWAAVVSSVGDSHTFTINGGQYLLTREIGSGFPNIVITNSIPTNTIVISQVTNNLYASYDADSVTTSTTNLWIDGWTNTLNLVAINPVNTLFNDVNGHNSLNFAGTSWYSNNIYAINQPNEVFIVAKIGGNFTDYGGVLDSTNNAVNRQTLAYYVATGNLDYWAGAELIGPRMPSNWCIYDMIFDGSSSLLYTNGNLCLSGNVGSNNGRGLLVGAICGYGPKAIMKVTHIDSYNTILDSASRSNQFNWLATRYNISH